MAKREILAGATDQTIDVYIQDSSSSTGAGLTGLVYNSASLTCYYRKGATGTPTALTLATQTVGGAHSDGGFVQVDSTNMPGQYRLDLSDTIVATSGMVSIFLRGATNMMNCVAEIEVVSVNKFDAVRMGMTALPNAAAEAAGGLYTRGTGAGQINQDANGRVDTRVAAISTAAIGTSSFAAGAIDATAIGTGAITGAKIAADAIGATQIAADAIGSSELAATAAAEIADAIWDEARSGHVTAGTFGEYVLSDVTLISGDSTAANNAEAFFDGTGYAGTNNVIPLVTLVSTLTTYTGNTVQTGDSFARIGAAGASLSGIPWNAAWDAEVQSEANDALVANNLDHLLAVAAVAGDAVDSSIVARLASKSATPAFSSFTNTTDSLEAIADGGGGGGGGGATAAQVWEYATRTLTSGVTTVGLSLDLLSSGSAANQDMSAGYVTIATINPPATGASHYYLVIRLTDLASTHQVAGKKTQNSVDYKAQGVLYNATTSLEVVWEERMDSTTPAAIVKLTDLVAGSTAVDITYELFEVIGGTTETSADANLRLLTGNTPDSD